MRLYGFLTVSAVLISLLPRSSALAITTLPEVQTNLLPLNYQYGGQASPDTSSSSSSEATAEYAGSESSEEACDCDQRHSAILDESSMASPTVLTSAASSSKPYSYANFILSTATLTPSDLQASPTPQPQQVNPSLAPAPTYVGPPVYAPPAPAIPSTITPAAALPTTALQAEGGQEWYQVTYWECVTWPSDYVHCGWHTPLRKGKNPDPNGESFVYAAGSSLKARVWLMGMVVAGVLLAAL